MVKTEKGHENEITDTNLNSISSFLRVTKISDEKFSSCPLFFTTFIWQVLLARRRQNRCLVFNL